MALYTSDITDTSKIVFMSEEVNVLEHTIYGDGTINNNELVLNGGETARFNITDDYNSKEINYIKLKVNIVCNNVKTDYEYLNIIKITGKGHKSSANKTFNKNFTFKFENENYYENELVFKIDDMYIDDMYIYISNNSNTQIRVTEFKTYRNEVEINSSNISNYQQDTGTYIEPRTDTPNNLYPGRIWFRTDYIV